MCEEACCCWYNRAIRDAWRNRGDCHDGSYRRIHPPVEHVFERLLQLLPNRMCAESVNQRCKVDNSHANRTTVRSRAGYTGYVCGS